MSTELMAQASQIELTQKGEVMLKNIGDAMIFASLMAKGAMLPQKVTIEQAAISMIAGSRLGLDAFQSVQGIAVINGRPAIWGDALTAVVKASGLLEDEKIEYLPNYKDCIGVRVTIKRKGIATPYTGLFSLEDAKKAGLLGRGVWASYPSRMLLNRARAFAYRDGFADVLKGIRVAEEEQDFEYTESKAKATKPKGKSKTDALLNDLAKEDKPYNPNEREEAPTTIDAEIIEAPVEDAIPLPL